MAKLSHTEALEAVYAERLRKKNGWIAIPTPFFVERIDVNTSGLPDLPEVSFYVFSDKEEPELIRKSGEPHSLLALSVHENIWVREDEFAIIRKFAEALMLENVSRSKKLTPEKKVEVLRRSAILIVEDLFTNPSPENVAKSQKVVSSFVHVLMKDPKAYLHLSQLSSHDPYTLQHSVGAATGSIILARKVGINDEKDLQEAGMAGLLHDIGKVKVKKEIINKNGPLDHEEWEEMRQHSLAGYEIVKDNPSLTERTKRAILEHHEDKEGTGYPQGLRHDQVDLYSKIVCLADIFNALTTNRSYSAARSPFDAFQLIREKLHHKVDEELFKQMVLIYGGKLELPSIDPQESSSSVTP